MTDDVDPSSDTIAATEPQPAPPTGASLPVSGYRLGEALGVGGMGEVLLARDTKIGRDVAIKRLRGSEPTQDAITRFLREAKVQARLDHPAIVPVYQLGEDAEGQPYFTMKRLVGTTLLDELRKSDVSLRRVLRAFVDVCLAIDFAHARGIIHRDLKPSNIMLGDYGEVYVLDWGIARVDGDPADTGSVAAGISTLEGQTQAGALLGTPGYMAPEQARSEQVGPAADVYALGAILFEILAGESLHPRGTHAALANTVTNPAQAPATRQPARAIAPELDEVCLAALASDPAQRPTARVLADRVQAYLDGDRDLERRRELAREELAHAQAAVRDPARRAEAARLAGRALVLDPESREAAALVLRLLVEPPAELPAEVIRELDAHETELARTASRAAIIVPFAYIACFPIVLWMGVRDWMLFAVFYAIVVVLALNIVREMRSARPRLYIPLVLNTAMMVCLSRLLSPWVFVPAITCVFTSSLGAQMGLWRRPVLLIAAGIGSVAVPLLLEATHVFGSTWSIDSGHLVIDSTAVSISSPSIVVLLLIGSLAAIVLSVVYMTSVAGSRDQARRQVAVQAWHLRQLLPAEARSSQR